MSRSCRLGIFNHLRRKCFLTLGSAWKMARGMALIERSGSSGSVSVKAFDVFRKRVSDALKTTRSDLIYAGNLTVDGLIPCEAYIVVM